MAPDDLEVEASFMRQASTYIQNKARPIFKQPYLLGFEVLKKGNEDNTRMVGAYAFNLGNNMLFYAPVFFINGEIRGNEFLYDHQKQFMYPLTNDWCGELLNNKELREGVSISKQETVKIRREIDLGGFLNSNGHIKRGFAEPILNEMFAVAQAEFESMGSTEHKSELKEFIKNAAALGIDARVGVADLIMKDETIGRAVYELIDPANYDFDLDVAVMKKEASAEPKEGIRLHKGRFGWTKSASAAHVQERMIDGYAIEDTRGEWVEKHASVIRENVCDEFQGISRDGVADVVMQDKSIQKCLVISTNIIAEVNAQSEGGGVLRSLVNQYGPTRRVYKINSKDVTMVAIDSSDLLDPGLPLDKRREVDITGMEIKPYKDIEWGTDVPAHEIPKEGETYALYMEDEGAILPLLHVTGVTTSKGKVATVTGIASSYNTVEWSLADILTREITISFNPDASRNHWTAGVLNPDRVRFIPLDVELTGDAVEGLDGTVSESLADKGTQYLQVNRLDTYPASSDQIPYMLMEGLGYDQKEGRVLKKSAGYQLVLGGETTPEIKEPEAIVTLMSICGCRESTARDLLSSPEPFFYKQAATMRFTDIPDWDEGYADELGIITVPAEESEVIGVETTYPYQPAPRIGDRGDPHNMGNAVVNQDRTQDAMATIDENYLVALAEKSGNPQVLEAGLIGNLADTYDASTIIPKHMPSMMRALDSMGRVYFLLHWKPEDFASTYGSDDNNELESLFKTNFEAYGDLMLKLIQKNHQAAEGVINPQKTDR